MRTPFSSILHFKGIFFIVDVDVHAIFVDDDVPVAFLGFTKQVLRTILALQNTILAHYPLVVNHFLSDTNLCYSG